MADIAVTSANVRAMTENGAIVRNYTSGAAITIGYAVYIAADGHAEHADANGAAILSSAVGIAVQSKDGETSVTSGDPVSVCVFGPVEGFTGATPGNNLYVSNTVGRIADAAGSYSRVFGRADSATCVWVEPVFSDAASA